MSLEDALARLMTRSDELDIQEFVKQWCSTYDGKVIDLDLDEVGYHLIFKADGTVSLKEGLSTSFDLRLILTSQTLLELLKGVKPMKEALKSGALKTWGNFHEVKPLEHFLRLKGV
ncbi:MAG: SCP2 sterol-binding domain-containing protein [Candidatus Heimdallarchaeota archaeon]